ncbi:hypothetical protein N9I19_18830 [Peribacillus sp. CSMR9]|nr:hypothetical protein [Peribacillus sp. CSMR9]MDV7766597.1 hypothetical protein [Peribacillus sp. CSMR9]
MHKFEKKIVWKEIDAYRKHLQNEINQEHEKKPFFPEKFTNEEEKEMKESTTDPESGYYVKNERTKQLAYSFLAASDETVL